MRFDTVKNEILLFLGAWPEELVRQALQIFDDPQHRETLQAGWRLWTQDGHPERPYEWRQIGETIYYRESGSEDTASVGTRRSHQRKPTSRSETVSRKQCPDCGAEAFAQSVCPKCSKGKAGIRKQWVCGENDDHVFYTE